MPDDSSLTDFFEEESDADEEAASGGDQETASGGDQETAYGGDRETASGDDERDADSQTSEESAASDGLDAATVTYEWSDDGGACADCGEPTRRRWRDDGSFVCADCKDW